MESTPFSADLKWGLGDPLCAIEQEFYSLT